MWDLAVREADFVAADSMLRRYHGTAPLSMRALSAFARRDSGPTRQLFEEARSAENRQPQIAARFVAVYLEDLDQAERFARLSLSPGRRAALRAGAQHVLAWLAVAGGRWSAAKTEFAAAERIEGLAPAAIVGRAMAATLPFLAVPVADLATIRRDLEQWSASAESSNAGAGLSQALAAHLRLYLLGLVRSVLGDYAGAAQAADNLERLPAPAPARDAMRALAQTVRADGAWRRGRFADGLASLESIRSEIPLELVNVPLYATVREYTLEHARYLRATLLHQLGRETEALRWLETSFQGAPNEFAYLAPAHMLRGEISEALNDRAKANEHYRRFIDLWKNCDPELRRTVQEAGKRLATRTPAARRGA